MISYTMRCLIIFLEKAHFEMKYALDAHRKDIDGKNVQSA